MIYNEFQPPLPRVSKRDIAAMKTWISPGLTTDGTAGTPDRENKTESGRTKVFIFLLLFSRICHVFY